MNPNTIARPDVRPLLCALLFTIAATSSTLAQRQELGGHMPRAIKDLSLQPVARLSGTNRLHLAIGLPLRNQEALNALLQQIYDPASPQYRHYLTPEQFTEKFGPTPEDYQAVIDFAKSNGLTVVETHPNRVVLDVEGTVADVEKALHVTMRVYQHPMESRTFYAPDVEPSLDLAVPVLDISGLDNYSLRQPKLKRKPVNLTANATPDSGSGPSGTYMGSDFRTAYVPGTSLTGAGQNVGLLQFDGYYSNDISSYISQAGISTSVILTNIPIDGGVSSPGSGNGEVSLDIEMVVSMAPGVSRIFVYEAPNPSPWVDLLSRMANDNVARQLSCSWGGGSANATAEQIFQQMAAQGQSFFNASGDSDAFSGTIPFPSDSTNITQVGGTTLTTGTGASYSSETVWNWGSGTGSSGGISTVYPIPSYQLGISMTANLGSTTMRNVPDVALTADNVYTISDNGTASTVGGTSCAAPLWAGYTALINQQAAANALPPVGFINPAVYVIGKGATYSNCFHDTTTGNNFRPGSTTKFPAVAGYDLCTGWGTPNGTNLINALAGAPIFAPVLVASGSTLLVEGCTPTNGFIDPGETVTVNFSLQNVGSADASNVVATLLATNGVTAPSASQSYGTLVAGGGAVSEAFTFTANGTCGSNITATLQIQTNSANNGTATFTFTLGAASATTNSFANTGLISIPTSGSSGKATPYPSTITVSAVAGPVTKVTVTLTNINHTWPDDISILLVGPGGQNVMLMSDAGGNAGVTPMSNVTVAFDDSAASPLPPSTQITSGAYRPGDYDSSEVLDAPAPAGPYGTVLSVFNGVNPNGTWSLYVDDDYPPADGGSIANGWKIAIITTTNSCCVGSSNHPPVITAASISPGSPSTTNILIVTGISTNDPDGDPITLAYQWQQSTNNVAFTNLTGQTANTLGAALTIAGDYYRVILTPNDGQTNGAPFTTASVLVPVDFDGNGINDDWEVQYFGHIGVDPNADPDGDGCNNLCEYLSGTDPTNSASSFHITSVTAQGPDLLITWATGLGRTNVVQSSPGLPDGSYSTDFTNVSPLIILPMGSGDFTTNYPDPGGATNFPAHYYRVRLVP